MNLLGAMMTTPTATEMATTFAGKKEATIITHKTITGLAMTKAATKATKMARWVIGYNLFKAMMTTPTATQMATAFAGAKETVASHKAITGLATTLAVALATPMARMAPGLLLLMVPTTTPWATTMATINAGTTVMRMQTTTVATPKMITGLATTMAAALATPMAR
jgi:hypothetical protein